MCFGCLTDGATVVTHTQPNHVVVQNRPIYDGSIITQPSYNHSLGTTIISQPSFGIGLGLGSTVISQPSYGIDTTIINQPSYGIDTTIINQPSYGNDGLETIISSQPSYGFDGGFQETIISEPSYFDGGGGGMSAEITSYPSDF